MPKVKTLYVCQSCGVQFPKWQGKCTSCNAWNTLVEERVSRKSTKSLSGANGTKAKAIHISEVATSPVPRILTADEELNRTLGGGIVPGSVILLGGEPGIGKSTLLLQMVLQLNDVKCAYISGEESAEQVKMRANRISSDSTSNIYILTNTSVRDIIKELDSLEPQIVVIDSVQTLISDELESAPGSVSQVRESTHILQEWAKQKNIPIILVGHITKEGSLAGPKVLEHMVDTVLQFEGDQRHQYRILRSLKNRFGATSELGIYEMNAQGLRPVTNPSEILIQDKEQWSSGIAIGATVEGQRVMLIECQALVTTSVFGTPQRSVTGYDLRRMNMLLAILEKRFGFAYSNKDVFLNMAGGLKIDDPAMDLAIIAALISSYEDKVISENICFAGEVGLAGEIRAVSRVDQRIAEGNKLGFKSIILSKFNKMNVNKSELEIKLGLISRVNDLSKIIV